MPPVLDFGYVNFVESWGSDERIIEAARMSTAGGFKGWGPFGYRCARCKLEAKERNSDPCPKYIDILKELMSEVSGGGVVAYGPANTHDWRVIEGDEKLLRYLWDHHHTTPFEMAGLTVEVMAPIMVFREWHRHRTQSYNEMSARYTPLPDVNYLPTIERCKLTSKTNRQAQGLNLMEPKDTEIEVWLGMLEDCYKVAQAAYEFGLKVGVPKELARLSVPVARYSKMRASTDLWNWLHFLRLRMDEGAQWEIRQFAIAVGHIIGGLFPRTWALFEGGLG